MAAASSNRQRPKSYDQYCPVACALDLLGERWTLLVVRELLMGPKRYTDLRAGLPGIASDLLTARLRTLESAGFVRRRELPRPAPARVYELTEAGWSLAPVVLALGQVGLRLLGAPGADVAVRAEPLVLSLRLTFRRDAYSDLSETYELVIDGEPFTVAVADGGVTTMPGSDPAAAITATTSAATLVALLRGDIAVDDALESEELALDGDREVIDRFVEAFAYPPELVSAPTAAS
jgi:DNA-binding HxlR family transcriptional regulator